MPDHRSRGRRALPLPRAFPIRSLCSAASTVLLLCACARPTSAPYPRMPLEVPRVDHLLNVALSWPSIEAHDDGIYGARPLYDSGKLTSPALAITRADRKSVV